MVMTWGTSLLLYFLAGMYLFHRFGNDQGRNSPPAGRSALDILKEYYVHGKIKRED